MTDQIGRRIRGSFSSLEILSVAAAILVLVMVSVPFPYASQKRGLPASHASPSRGYVDADSKSGDKLESSEAGRAGAAGYAAQGSPFEVRTAGLREFCADMPGVVRFSTSGGRCKNGAVVNNPQSHRDAPIP